MVRGFPPAQSACPPFCAGGFAEGARARPLPFIAVSVFMGCGGQTASEGQVPRGTFLNHTNVKWNDEAQGTRAKQSCEKQEATLFTRSSLSDELRVKSLQLHGLNVSEGESSLKALKSQILKCSVMTCKVNRTTHLGKTRQQEREEEKDTAAAAKWRTGAQGRRTDAYVSRVQIHRGSWD